MDQRGRVDHFHHGCKPDGSIVAIARQPGREQEQNRPQPFPTAVVQIPADCGDDIDAGNGLQTDLSLHAIEVAVDEV